MPHYPGFLLTPAADCLNLDVRFGRQNAGPLFKPLCFLDGDRPFLVCEQALGPVASAGNRQEDWGD